MIRVAAEQFTTDSAAYLDLVAAGTDVLIERDGKVIAKLVAEPGPDLAVAATSVPLVAGESELVREFRAAREGLTLGGIDWKELRDEGRR